ncbi:uncharacterized protein MEPE_01912 [Melanopsichium pennsylvanicum]|uniref:Uncharacterized protein n=1 Tax=Melanopsichium pennsylvanicum TaxID=63383 RepID=A0AAJ5C414_9BASI|nr:uncharacterized protein MEPE_01912 [Melanopsichium pennsylvanicum]
MLRLIGHDGASVLVDSETYGAPLYLRNITRQALTPRLRVIVNSQRKTSQPQDSNAVQLRYEGQFSNQCTASNEYNERERALSLSISLGEAVTTGNSWADGYKVVSIQFSVSMQRCAALTVKAKRLNEATCADTLGGCVGVGILLMLAVLYCPCRPVTQTDDGRDVELVIRMLCSFAFSATYSTRRVCNRLSINY